MEGNVRTFDEIFRKEIETHIREIAESVAKAHSCTAKLEYRYGTGVVLNKDKNLVDIAQNAVKKLYGEDSLVEIKEEQEEKKDSKNNSKIEQLFSDIIVEK